MSEQRITQLEKEMAVVQATVPPLIAKIEQMTDAITILTTEIKSLIHGNDAMKIAFNDIKADVKENTKKLNDLEKSDAVRRSGDQVVVWIKRTVVVAIVAALAGLVITK